MGRWLLQPVIVIPLLIGLSAKILIGAYLRTLGCDGWDSLCWVRWDSGLYLGMVQKGRTLFLCDTVGKVEWCGNAGWAPLFPWLTKLAATILKIRPEVAGVWISGFFFFGCLLLSARLMDIRTWAWKNWLAVLLVAFCPGFIYFHAFFPVSQTLFFLLLVWFGLTSRRYFLTGIGGFFAVLSYSSGLFILFPVLAFIAGLWITGGGGRNVEGLFPGFYPHPFWRNFYLRH